MASEERALKSSRQKCHEARDIYLRCSDENPDDEKKCRIPLKNFKAECPESWVGHFIRKHRYDKYKRELVEKGVLSADEKHEKKP
ncbi:Cytochrome c oxidase assembly factor 6-like protein [Aphelenchoides besseyi]|nr:Cytochrome c oxidase assembly factor 6-like protein [Aphelenchoides besseyi]KAI6224050.1 Cytochrome c oxidase assembly factor 6-like protein [Aphelenchoides besseyi]